MPDNAGESYGHEWPADVVAIYEEIEAEDRRLAEAMVPGMTLTWPRAEALARFSIS